MAREREARIDGIRVLGVESGGAARMLGGEEIESQTTERSHPRMNRNAEFAAQLSRLMTLYAHPPVDHDAEKAALRAARAAAKHGAVNLVVHDGELNVGAHPEGVTFEALESLFNTLGIRMVHAVHHAKQEEIRHLASLLGSAFVGHKTALAFASAVREFPWQEISVDIDTPPQDEGAAAGVGEPGERGADAQASPDEAAAPSESVTVSAEDVRADDAEAPSPDGPASAAGATAVTEGASVDTLTATPPSDAASGAAALPDASPRDALQPEAAHAPPPSATSGPLATQPPLAVTQLARPAHRELFERLITSSEAGTLRRLLEPVLTAIEQCIRDGSSRDAVQLLRAVIACEACATDPEMQRQFFIVLRRLTKPTLLRAIAMLYTDAPEYAAGVEEVLARFGEDGAEAVADRIGGAPTTAQRDMYVALLARLTSAHDALLAMLDDDRPVVVERALSLLVRLGYLDVERTLADQLSHTSARVRNAAVRGLGVQTGSSFAADALLRAVQDSAPEVRLAAAVALQARREARLAAPIAQRVDEEPELDVQMALVAALGRVASADAVQKLVTMAVPDQRAARRRNAAVLRLSAIEALGEARTPAAMAALQKLLEDPAKDVRESAARLYSRARRQTAAVGMSAVTDA